MAQSKSKSEKVELPAKLAKALGHEFKDQAVLLQALTHSSLEQTDVRQFDRLEFLGDRVLGLIIAEMLQEAFPTETEGELARRHAALVSRDTLALLARKIGLDEGLRNSGEAGDAELADGMEALIAALYLDGGLAAAQTFHAKHFKALIKKNLKPPKDPKSALQEWAQARALPLPQYEVLDQHGPDHAPTFVVAVTIKNVGRVEAEGASKRLAEVSAAEQLLHQINAESI